MAKKMGVCITKAKHVENQLLFSWPYDFALGQEEHTLQVNGEVST